MGRSLAILVVLTAVSWFLGFALGEDSSGGAVYDFRTFHWRASLLFADEPFWLVLQDYPSATTPLQHMFMAALPWVHDPVAYRLSSFCIGTLALLIFGLAVKRRFELRYPSASMATVATAAVALSPGFRSATFWGDTDALPLLFTAIVSLVLHDRKTGTWRETVSLGRITIAAVAGAAAFYTRQLYIFVPVWSFVLLWPRGKNLRLMILLIFALTAVPALILLWLWGGFTPPRFKQIGSVSNLLYVGALAVPFTLPFVFGQRLSSLRWPTQFTRIALSLTLLLLIIAFHGTALTTYGGGPITKIGLLLGPAGIGFVIVVSVFGWWAIASAATSAPNNAFLFGFAIIPLLLAGNLLQRYFDPLAFTIVLLLASPPLAARVNMRSILASYVLFLFLEVIGLTWYIVLDNINHND